MGNETKEGTKESGTVTEKTATVTDEMLDAALLGAQEDEEGKKEGTNDQEKKEGEGEEKKPEEAAKTKEEDTETPPTDPNALRSWMGRREARLKKELLSSIDNLLAQRLPKAPAAEPTVKPLEDEDLPEVIATPDDVERVLAVREQKKARKQAEYQAGYVKTLQDIATEEGEEYQSVEEEIFNPENKGAFNKIITGNPSVDAKMNFLAAKSALLSKKLASASAGETKVIPGRGDSPKGSSVPVTTKNATSTKPPVNLDDDAKRFLKFIGKDEDWAREALAGR